MKKNAGAIIETALLVCFVLCIALALSKTFIVQQSKLANTNLTVTTRK